MAKCAKHLDCPSDGARKAQQLEGEGETQVVRDVGETERSREQAGRDQQAHEVGLGEVGLGEVGRGEVACGEVGREEVACQAIAEANAVTGRDAAQPRAHDLGP